MRVLHVIGGLELGGAETLLYRLVTHPMPGVEHRVICLGNCDWYSPLLAAAAVPVEHFGMTSAASVVAGLSRLRRGIRGSGADVVQSWMYFANVLSGLCARGTRIPVVWGIHGSTLEHLGAPSHLCARLGGKFARQLSNYVINCSARSAELHASLGYSAVPNSVIPNGYDPSVFRPDDRARKALRRSLGIEDSTFLVGSFARWHPQKDIPNLVRALRLAGDRGVPLKCLLIGRGLDSENVRLGAEIRKNGCEDLAVALGSRRDVQDLARALDLHLLSSSGGEAFPNVVAETMLSGTPNAVTDVGDSALIVGDTGWIVPPGDAAKLSEAIEISWRERSGEAHLWESRRSAARQRVVENYTFDRMADAYLRVWRQVRG